MSAADDDLGKLAATDPKQALADAMPEVKAQAMVILTDAYYAAQAMLEGRAVARAEPDGTPLSIDDALARANRLEAKLAGEVKLRDDGAALLRLVLERSLQLAETVALAGIALP